MANETDTPKTPYHIAAALIDAGVPIDTTNSIVYPNGPGFGSRTTAKDAVVSLVFRAKNARRNAELQLAYARELDEMADRFCAIARERGLGEVTA